jgi:hypothetical protein
VERADRRRHEGPRRRTYQRDRGPEPGYGDVGDPAASRDGSKGKAKITYVRIASATVSSARTLATIAATYTSKPGVRLVCRVVARNQAGSITSATNSLVLRAPAQHRR